MDYLDSRQYQEEVQARAVHYRREMEIQAIARAARASEPHAFVPHGGPDYSMDEFKCAWCGRTQEAHEG